VTLAGLVLAFLLKRPCTEHGWDGYQYTHLCYNDIQPLFHVRGIDRAIVPYSSQNAGTELQVEYPVVTGLFMDLSGRVLRAAARLGWAENSDPDYFVLSAILLAPFAFIATVKLRRTVRFDRLLLWALGPPLILYAFHNWDLLAVAGAVWGLLDAQRRRATSSGVALALGASSKLYPAFFVPGALLSFVARKDRRRTVVFVVGFVAAALAANLPWIIRSFSGWMAVWKFHSSRYPDFGTVWYWIAQHLSSLAPSGWWSPGNSGYRDLVSVLSLVLFAGGSIFFIWWSWRRRNEPGGYPITATALGILSVFLLVSKVHSPQYALWMVPLLVMLNVPWRFVALYLGADVLLFVSGFYWFTVFEAPAPGWKGIFEVSVFLRAAALGALAWWATRAQRLLPARS
jgi:uncharacterized membrane protein